MPAKTKTPPRKTPAGTRTPPRAGQKLDAATRDAHGVMRNAEATGSAMGWRAASDYWRRAADYAAAARDDIAHRDALDHSAYCLGRAQAIEIAATRGGAA